MNQYRTNPSVEKAKLLKSRQKERVVGKEMLTRKSLVILIASLVLLSTTAWAQEGPYNEAPQLRQLVEQGQLPPLEERLPQNPMVIEPVERVGDYGGTWRMGLLSSPAHDRIYLGRTLGYEGLVRWNSEWTQVIPNVAEAFEASDDATEFTFHLRRGLKWSDGEPFTADDIMFWYEDVLMNPDLTAVYPSWLVIGGEPVVVEKLDDYTVVFRFSEPSGLFLPNMAADEATIITSYPRHYLEQFHLGYNSEGLPALVQAAGVTDWRQLFENMATAWWANPDKPNLHAWVLTNAYDGTTARLVAERNPYYFKVDTAGNQLPYIDQVTYDLFGDIEVILLRTLNGEFDFQHRHVETPENRAVLYDNQDRGDYRFFELHYAQSSPLVVSFNLTHGDPVKREIFGNKDFRIGLSHAINREELIDLIYFGIGEPWQTSPLRETPFYNEQLAKQYTEFDLDLANEYLDRAFPERDAQGYRLGPDGRRISFAVEVQAEREQHRIDGLELIAVYWQAVGIDMQVRPVESSLWLVRVASNEHDAAVFGGEGAGQDALLNPRYYFPDNPQWSLYGIAWAQWYVGDPRGEEPPANVRRQMELYEQLKSTADEARQIELFEEILQIAADEFHSIGIGTRPHAVGIIKNHFRNVPNTMFYGGTHYFTPAPTNTSQYFIEGGGNP